MAIYLDIEKRLQGFSLSIQIEAEGKIYDSAMYRRY